MPHNPKNEAVILYLLIVSAKGPIDMRVVSVPRSLQSLALYHVGLTYIHQCLLHIFGLSFNGLTDQLVTGKSTCCLLWNSRVFEGL